MYRQTKAQMSIDFLIGIVIFIGALFFVFQFMSGTILPFAEGANEKTVTVDKVSDSLYYDKMGTDEKGVIDLRYLYNESRGEVVSEEKILKDMNVDTLRHSLNITVVKEDGVGDDDVEVVGINENGLADLGDEARIGSNIPTTGSVNKATRVGYVRETAPGTDPETVVVRIRMW